MLSKYFGRSPAKLTQEDLRGWVSHLMACAVSSQRQRQHFAAMKFLYTKTLARPTDVAFLSWPRDVAKLPEILSAEEVERLLGAFRNVTYRVLAAVLYGAGLRLSEALWMETHDIDAARGVIRVRPSVPTCVRHRTPWSLV